MPNRFANTLVPTWELNNWTLVNGDRSPLDAGKLPDPDFDEFTDKVGLVAGEDGKGSVELTFPHAKTVLASIARMNDVKLRVLLHVENPSKDKDVTVSLSGNTTVLNDEEDVAADAIDVMETIPADSRKWIIHEQAWEGTTQEPRSGLTAELIADGKIIVRAISFLVDYAD